MQLRWDRVSQESQEGVEGCGLNDGVEVPSFECDRLNQRGFFL
jgi:hypothetical protein